MSHSEGKAEIQVSRPGHTFPFSCVAVPTQPHITQWCRFSVPERFPLQPFRKDRLNRLPLPPSLMATSKTTNLCGAGVGGPLSLQEKRSGDIDPVQKIQQLEKNLAFVRENHVFMLQGLHKEISDLKQKNRELQFELVTGLPALPKENIPQTIEKDPTVEKEKIEKLEKEIKKLRAALKDAIKSNTSLTSQLQTVNREQTVKSSSRNKEHSKTSSKPVIEDEHYNDTPKGPSPQMEEYSDTLRQIQRAAAQRSGKRGERRRHYNSEGKSEWTESYMQNGNGYHQHHHRHHHHYHHQSQKSPQSQQARLPRIPLRNQQNYSHQQYEIQYRQRSSNTLPALKQALVPVVDHLEKPRKSRTPRPTKVDQVNG